MPPRVISCIGKGIPPPRPTLRIYFCTNCGSPLCFWNQNSSNAVNYVCEIYPCLLSSPLRWTLAKSICMGQHVSANPPSQSASLDPDWTLIWHGSAFPLMGFSARVSIQESNRLCYKQCKKHVTLNTNNLRFPLGSQCSFNWCPLRVVNRMTAMMTKKRWENYIVLIPP